MKYIYVLGICMHLLGCYGVNKETTKIGVLNTDCMDADAWPTILETYSVSTIEDSIFSSKVLEIRDKIFDTEIFYFRDDPEEIIAISKNHYLVRYVYNPTLGSDVLDGLSSEIDDYEKSRITNRVQRVIMEYQCDEGKFKSLKLMESPK